MPRPDQDYVEACLADFEDMIADIVLAAWENCRDDRSRHRYKRTLRCIMHEALVDEARIRFEGDPRVHMWEQHETAYFMFGNAVIARLKHGDGRGLGKNNHTQSSFGFVSAEAEPWELPLGLPDKQRVDIVYLLNDIETRIEQILVTGRDGDKPLWNFPLYPRKTKPIVVLPVTSPAPRPAAGPAGVLRVPSDADIKGKKGE